MVRRLLRRAHRWRPDEIAAVVDAELAPLGVTAVIHLIDHEQRVLRPLPHPGTPPRAPLPVAGTVGGHAFATVRTRYDRSGGRWWVPLVDGTDRHGVVALSGPGPDADPAPLEMLAALLGHLIVTTEPRGDHVERQRRSRHMSPAAELLLKVLPPLTASSDRVALSAVLEPCYEVGGDGFDYAFDGDRVSLVLLDAVGRGLRAALAGVTALSAVRSARRVGADLRGQTAAADAALLEQFDDARFATAVLAELDVSTGVLTYLNAGHPPPVVLRAGMPVGRLDGGRRLPLGVAADDVAPARAVLAPGDRLLVWTDGVSDVRSASGEFFGVDRLVRLAGRHVVAGLPLPESARRLVTGVLDHQDGPPVDDATLLLLEWSRAAAERTVPEQG